MKYTLPLFSIFAVTIAQSKYQAPAMPDSCVAACNKAKTTCFDQPSHNATVCSEDYVKCIGYEPGLEEPTACRSVGDAATATPSSGSKPDSCVAACNKAKTTCFDQPSHNATVCSEDYVKCIGYEPGLEEPTACRSVGDAATATPSSGSKPDTCVAACNKAKTTCFDQPSHNATVCSEDYVKCIGYEPGLEEPTTCRSVGDAATATPSSDVTVVTAAAAYVSPVMGLLALGVFALL
ncbi:surface protein SP1 [Fusarium pseudocircinatum]|uniref:Surface protein SP1 n=1 Tax=Fusarium pseudocircinatum TaxID=56676 RepID=A0A8H5UTX0_9HYPO|nr:surface protein SP1 [Fusarium pseudocircinatum]